jgi:DNA-binding transcriptional LysR family regulator
MARLRNGTLDVAVIPFTNPNWEDLVEVHLYDEELAIYASANHRLAKRRQVTLAELAQEQWTLHSRDTPRAQLLTREFGALGLPPPKITIETQSMMARFNLVAMSDLLTFGSKLVAQHAAGHLGIKELRMQGLTNSRRVGVRYRRDAYLPPAALRFIEVLKKVTSELGKVGAVK